jgi:hypothetical protein
MSISTTVTALKTAFETDLPALLTAKSLSNLEKYYDYHIENPDKTSLSVYFAERSNLEDFQSLTILVEVNLPKVLDPSKYIDVLTDYVDDIKASDYGFHTLQDITAATYPGDWGGNYGGCSILIELQFTKQKDSCD